MPRIYVACLASYNSGKLHGEWIGTTQDADDIRSEIAAMLRKSPCPNVMVDCPDCVPEDGPHHHHTCPTCHDSGKVPSAEEYAIHDYEGFAGCSIGEYDDIDTIAKLSEILDEMDDDRQVAFAAWWNMESRDIDTAADDFDEQYQGVFDDLADYAYRHTEDTDGMSGCPEHLKNYIDWEKMGRDFQLGGDIWVHEAGYKKLHVFSN